MAQYEGIQYFVFIRISIFCLLLFHCLLSLAISSDALSTMRIFLLTEGTDFVLQAHLNDDYKSPAYSLKWHTEDSMFSFQNIQKNSVNENLKLYLLSSQFFKGQLASFNLSNGQICPSVFEDGFCFNIVNEQLPPLKTVCNCFFFCKTIIVMQKKIIYKIH